MKTNRKLLSLLLVVALVLSLSVFTLADEGDMSGQIVILHSNDVHGAIEGYAKMAALKAEYEARGAYVLTMDAGDFSQGTTKVSVSKGATAVELMNLVGYDVITLGNHEFDYGYAQLCENLKAADFEIVAANVKYNGSVAFDDNTVFTAPDGTKIGVFGLSTPETATKANPAMIKGVSFEQASLVSIAKAQVAALEKEECDIIVCLGHLGTDDESEPYRSVDVIAAVPGIDLFIDGHSHSVIVGNDNEYETGDTMLVSTGTAFANIGVVTYANGALSGELVAVTDEMAQDETVKAASDAIAAEIEELYGTVFATSEVVLNGNRAPGNRTEETNLGDLICDAMVWKCKEDGLTVDAAVTNGGGIRAAIQIGDITKNDINTVLPFGNTMAVVTVTGEELLEALEASTYCTPTAVGGFPQVSGIKFTLDTTVPYDAGDNYPGSTYAGPNSIGRVTIESVGGKAFSKTATYNIVTNNFTAAGGDTYYVFSAASSNVDTGLVLDEVVMEYIDTALNGVVTAEEYGAPKGNITIITCPFTDIAAGDWFYSYIISVWKSGLMNGTSDTTFSPDENMDRAQIVTMLYRLAGSPAVEGSVSEVFADCADGEWYSNAVLWASQKGIVDGKEEGAFAPFDSITRQELAKIIYGYALANGAAKVTDTALAYEDAASIADWALEGVAYCYAEGIMQGETDTAFNAEGSAVRAAGAKVLSLLAA